jgi:hypothetical protein
VEPKKEEVRKDENVRTENNHADFVSRTNHGASSYKTRHDKIGEGDSDFDVVLDC